MKIITIAAVTAGGKTTIVNEIKRHLPNVKTLHFDDYSFEGEVDDFYNWVIPVSYTHLSVTFRI